MKTCLVRNKTCQRLLVVCMYLGQRKKISRHTVAIYKVCRDQPLSGGGLLSGLLKEIHSSKALSKDKKNLKFCDPWSDYQ